MESTKHLIDYFEPIAELHRAIDDGDIEEVNRERERCRAVLMFLVSETSIYASHIKEVQLLKTAFDLGCLDYDVVITVPKRDDLMVKIDKLKGVSTLERPSRSKPILDILFLSAEGPWLIPEEKQGALNAIDNFKQVTWDFANGNSTEVELLGATNQLKKELSKKEIKDLDTELTTYDDIEIAIFRKRLMGNDHRVNDIHYSVWNRNEDARQALYKKATKEGLLAEVSIAPSDRRQAASRRP